MKSIAHSGFRRLVCCALLALPVCAMGQRYRFDAYQQAQGLNNLQAEDMAFDKSGFLWVATENGLVRFLGANFEHYGPEQGLLERNVAGVYVDDAGRVWVVTRGSLYLKDGDRFSRVSQAHYRIGLGHRLLGLPGNRMLLVDGGKLLELDLDADNKLRSSKPFFAGAMLKAQPVLDQISTLALAPDGTLWMGCGTKLCSATVSQAPDKVRVWGEDRGVKAARWESLLIDSRGSTWARSKTYLLELSRGSANFVDRSPPNTNAGRVFFWFPILEDRAGRILVGSPVGLMRWDGLAWQTIDEGNGLTPSRVTTLVLDANGEPWVGTIAAGIWHWTGYEHWEGWTEAEGLPSSGIWSVGAQRADELLIGTIKGPARLDLKRTGGNAPEVFSLTGGRPWTYGQVGGIVRDARDTIWVGTFAGSVVRIDPKTLRATSVAEVKALVHRVFRSSSGSIWILSGNGIDVVDHPELKPVVRHVAEADHLMGGITNTASVTIARDRNRDGDVGRNTRADARPEEDNLWFLNDEAILHMDGGVWSRPKILGLDMTHIQPKELASAADGSLWLYGQDAAQNAGIWHLRPEGAALRAERLTLPANLSGLLPMTLLADSRGWLWLGTDYGVAAWNGSVWRVFNQENGMIWNDVSRGVAAEGADGSIWVGTSGGVAHLSHPERLFDPIHFSVSITSMLRGEKNFDPGEAAELPWAKTPVRLRFASPDTWNRSSLMFSYRLIGLDTQWMSTTETEATFPSLPPGEYRFEVYGKNPQMNATAISVGTNFRILPPWWRTNVFYGFCALAVALLLWIVLWLRTRHLILNREKLERLVSERTEELERSQEALRIQATHDALTGLLNRAAVLARLDFEIERAARDRSSLALLLIDIDYFN